jgi:hypothetical protein
VKRLFTATAALCAVLGGSAQASTFNVTGTADPAPPVACAPVDDEFFSCPSLRAAVDAVNARGDEDDQIFLPAGTYTLTAGQLTVSESVLVVGDGAKATTIAAAGSGTRAFQVSSGAALVVNDATMRGGSLPNGTGGAFLVDDGSSLALNSARVTGGSAGSGGAITNRGYLTVGFSLLDGNTAGSGGGAIFHDGESARTELFALVSGSTFANNRAPVGAAYYASGDTHTELYHVTMGNNAGGAAFALNGDEGTRVYGSLLAGNPGGNCLRTSGAAAEFTLESGTSCGFAGTSNRSDVDPGLATALSDQGGPTSVLTIPATSPAVDLVNPCVTDLDQRRFRRFVAGTTAPCDAGAYEQSAVGEGAPVPTPTPTPTPSPTPTPPPTPTPVAGRSVAATPTRGTVRVKLPGGSAFTPLAAGIIPVGAEVDARRGGVRITRADGGAATFSDGQFRLSESGGITTLTLTEKLACGKRAARAAAAKPRTRKLWGDGKGRFRTRGEYSSATVRGTRWLVQDTCTTTLTRVTEGAVTVRDLVKRRTVVLRKGKRYTARGRG